MDAFKIWAPVTVLIIMGLILHQLASIKLILVDIVTVVGG